MHEASFRWTPKPWWVAVALAVTGGAVYAQGFAFGIERISGDFVRFELGDPETMTALGSSGASTVVNACEFDAGGGYEVLYCVDTSAPANYFALDTRSGARTNLGTISLGGSTFLVALATDPISGVVYALVCASGFVGSLHTFDLVSGELAFVAALSSPDCIAAAGFDDSGAMFGLDSANDALVAIDKATGTVTTLGSIGFDSTYVPTIDFAAAGSCYLFAFNDDTGVGELRTCDTTTGSTTFAGHFGSDSPGGWGSMSAAAVHPGGLFADGFELEDSSRWSLTSPMQ